MPRTPALIAFAAVVGLGLALSPERAVHGDPYGSGKWIRFLFTPQAGLSSACLSCGWHDGAYDENPGRALDFPASCSGEGVYLRTLGQLPAGSPNTYVAYAYYSIPPQWDCKEVDALLRDVNGVLLGTMRYVHTEDPWPQIIDLFASGSDYLNEQPFVEMASQEKASCLQHDPPWWTGVHLHEAHDNTGNSTLFLNTARYPSGPQAWPYPTYNPHNWDNWARTFCVDDYDCDGWTGTQEDYIGTDPGDECADNPSDAAWPPDFDNNRLVNIVDVQQYRGRIGCAPSAACRRLDMDASGVVNIVDLQWFRGRVGTLCSN